MVRMTAAGCPMARGTPGGRSKCQPPAPAPGAAPSTPPRRPSAAGAAQQPPCTSGHARLWYPVHCDPAESACGLVNFNSVGLTGVAFIRLHLDGLKAASQRALGRRWAMPINGSCVRSRRILADAHCHQQSWLLEVIAKAHSGTSGQRFQLWGRTTLQAAAELARPAWWLRKAVRSSRSDLGGVGQLSRPRQKCIGRCHLSAFGAQPLLTAL